jgi:hypothetical protein
MEEIKREFRPLVIAGDEQHGDPRNHKIHKWPNQFIEDFSWDVVLVKKISAMNEKISLHLKRVLYNSHKILEDGLSPILPSSGVRLGQLGNLKSKMCIGSMNELQNFLTDNSKMNPDE